MKAYDMLGIDFPNWNDRCMTIKEVEHALCEFLKYTSWRGTQVAGYEFKSRPREAALTCPNFADLAGTTTIRG
jgi:hypothetical protein